MGTHHDTRSGKCSTCRVRYVWRFQNQGNVRPLRGAYCPVCGAGLQQTTHLLRWPVSKRFPVYNLGRALELRAAANKRKRQT